MVTVLEDQDLGKYVKCQIKIMPPLSLVLKPIPNVIYTSLKVEISMLTKQNKTKES